MKKTSKTIVFFGNERLATGVSTDAPTLRALIDNGYVIAAVISNYSDNVSRTKNKPEVMAIAANHGIPVWLPSRLSEIEEQIKGLRADIGVLVAYGKIIPQRIIDIFPGGIVNIHPSLLPLHRGPTPIESVILDGSQKTGVSLMQLVKQMDAGPVFAQQTVSLNGDETKPELAKKLLELGKDMLIKSLPNILDGSLIPQPQNNASATYDRLITKHDGIVDWNKSAVQIEREIRAFATWPKSKTALAGKDVAITKAHVSRRSSQKPGQISVEANILAIACGGGTLLVDRLKPAGKQEMKVQAFLAGYGSRL